MTESTTLDARCTCDPGPMGEHHDYCETRHPDHPCDARTCRFALATLNAAVERIATADIEFLREVLGEIAQGHEPNPDWDGPPRGTCTTCGGTGIVYHGTGEDGHIWGPETCCCDHNHCVKCFTCCDVESGDLQCPELLLIVGETVAVRS